MLKNIIFYFSLILIFGLLVFLLMKNDKSIEDRIINKILLLKKDYPDYFSKIEPVEEKIKRDVDGSIQDFLYSYNMKDEPNPGYGKVGGWSSAMPYFKIPGKNGIYIELRFGSKDWNTWSQLEQQKDGWGFTDGKNVVFREIITDNLGLQAKIEQIINDEGFNETI